MIDIHTSGEDNLHLLTRLTARYVADVHNLVVSGRISEQNAMVWLGKIAASLQSDFVKIRKLHGDDYTNW